MLFACPRSAGRVSSQRGLLRDLSVFSDGFSQRSQAHFKLKGPWQAIFLREFTFENASDVEFVFSQFFERLP